MNRRDFVKSSAYTAAGIAANSAFAKSHEHKHKHEGNSKLEVSGFNKKKLTKVAKTAQNCVDTGEKCIAHCVTELASGNTMMASCQAIVLNTVAVCEGLATLANLDTLPKKEFAAYVQSCSAICKLCSDECEAHKKHDACKACMKACLDCIKACDSLVG
ncbi:MAG: Csp1 family four helix bundle copper storage protein [Pseudomonadota bacterium]